VGKRWKDLKEGKQKQKNRKKTINKITNTHNTGIQYKKKKKEKKQKKKNYKKERAMPAENDNGGPNDNVLAICKPIGEAKAQRSASLFPT